MTPRQSQCLKFMAAYEAQYGVPPSFEEIKDGLSLKSKSGVSRLVLALVDQGYVQKNPGRDRSYSVAKQKTEGACPACGRKSDRQVLSLNTPQNAQQNHPASHEVLNA